MATRTRRYGAAITSLRRYAFVPRYRPEENLTLVTADGVRLYCARLAGPAGAPATVVLVHGFANSSSTPRIHAFAHLLARYVHVLVPDLRGHGRSQGRCTLGVDEPLDVAAAVEAADPSLPVVTLGLSLGGAAVLLHAGTFGGVAGVVAVSAPAWWGAWDTRSTDRVRRYVSTRAGRLFLSSVLRTRVVDHCDGVPDSRDIVASITPAFTLVVHDPRDHYFDEEHARTIYQWANEPKGLWLVDDAGHGTDLLTPELADRLQCELERRLT